MDEFTKAERARIDYLYGTDFEGDISTDDVKLIARFERVKAEQQIEFEQQSESAKNDAKRANDEAQGIFAKAMSNLDELHTRAIARMDRLEKREHISIEDAQKSEIKIENRSAVSHDGK